MSATKTVFCDELCEDSWRTDRRYGVIYPACRQEDGSLASWFDAHVAIGACPYCQHEVKEEA